MTRYRADDLLRHTGILFFGMVVVHLCNLLFQMAVSRALPENEYALLAAFLGVLLIIQRPLSTLTTSISHYSSLLAKEGRAGDVKRLVRKWMFLSGTPALLLGAAAVFWHQPLTSFLHLDRPEPVLVAGLVLPALFWVPVLIGAGQGLQLFKWCSAATIFGAVLRLGLGAGFVWFLYPACGWAMLGHGLGLYAAAGLLLVGILWMLRHHRTSTIHLPSMRHYLLQSFFVIAAFAVLMTADVVLVKHLVPHDTEFAYAATLSRVIVFIPGVIVTAMFPKVTSRGRATVEQKQLFIRSFSWTALFAVTAALVSFPLAGPLAHLIFGIRDASPHLKTMIGVMALVMSLSALLHVTVQFLLAQRRFAAAMPTVVCSIVYVAGVMLSSHETRTVVLWAALANACALLCGLGSILRQSSSREHAPDKASWGTDGKNR